jgi:hypothetical protein
MIDVSATTLVSEVFFFNIILYDWPFLMSKQQGLDDNNKAGWPVGVEARSSSTGYP